MAMNGIGLRCESRELKSPSRIQDIFRYTKELEILPKYNRSQYPMSAGKQHGEISILI